MEVASGIPDPKSLKQVSFKDDLYEVYISANKVWDTNQLRVCYSSLASPLTWYELVRVVYTCTTHRVLHA